MLACEVQDCNIGALIIRIAFLGQYTIIIIRNPKRILLVIIQASIIGLKALPNRVQGVLCC